MMKQTQDDSFAFQCGSAMVCFESWEEAEISKLGAGEGGGMC